MSSGAELYDLTELAQGAPRGDAEYVPDTDTIRAMYATDYYMVEVRGHALGERAAAFDRWLKAHDDEVARAALEAQRATVAEAVAALHRDVEHGIYSGGGYHYVEATPEPLLELLAAFD